MHPKGDLTKCEVVVLVVRHQIHWGQSHNNASLQHPVLAKRLRPTCAEDQQGVTITAEQHKQFDDEMNCFCNHTDIHLTLIALLETVTS